MIELQEDILEQEITNTDRVIVQYGAAWCGNCRLVKPKFKRISSENEDVKFIYVDAEKHPHSRRLAEVKSLPTFAGFVNGKLVGSSTGSKEEIIKEVLNAIAIN